MSELASADLRLGKSAFAKIMGTADAASAVIYSKNCYAAVADTFTWTKLDRCGAFDAMAAQQLLSDGFAGTTEDAAYLESESAAQRYLSAGISHGAVAAMMDDRWASVSDFAQAATVVAAGKVADAEALPMDDIADDTPLGEGETEAARDEDASVTVTD